MFDAAKRAGIWIVLRPGPYVRLQLLGLMDQRCTLRHYSIKQINAETTAGGLALWSTSLTHSELRTNATDIEASWQQYIDAIIDLTVRNQISNGGPVIAVQIGMERSH